MKSTYRELVRQGFGFTNLNYTAVFSYDAAGRLVREGDKTYRYGYLDKVLSVTDGKRSYRYAYHVDGQLARADYGDGGRAGSPLPAGSEAFHWDGLALVRRGDESFVNEPHAGDAPKKLRSGGKPRAKRSARRARKGPRGNPVVSSKGTAYFNDVLGTTLGVKTKQDRKYSAAALTAFGEGGGRHAFFTGKPLVEGLGRVFLMRNYRADLAKWQTADPLGYPDGWNPLAYCGNRVTDAVDLWGAGTITLKTRRLSWHIRRRGLACIDLYAKKGGIVPKGMSGERRCSLPVQVEGLYCCSRWSEDGSSPIGISPRSSSRKCHLYMSDGFLPKNMEKVNSISLQFQVMPQAHSGLVFRNFAFEYDE